MKKPKSIWTKKNFTLSTLGLLSAFSSIAAIALINPTTNTTNNLAKTINSKTVLPSNKQIQRNITDNITNNQSINNPDEVFYTDQELATKDVWDAAGKQENATNKAYFDNFKKNLEAINDSSPIKDELLKINEEIDKYIEFKKFEKEYTDNTNITDLVP